MDPRTTSVLEEVYNTIRDKGIRWVLVGSTSLALQGVDIEPSDIDILTDRDGAYRIESLLMRYQNSPVQYGEVEQYRSHFGSFLIANFQVEVMGDLEERSVGGEWFSLTPRLDSPKIVECEGMHLPVSPLEDHLESYQRSNRPKDQEKIEGLRRLIRGEA